MAKIKKITSEKKICYVILIILLILIGLSIFNNIFIPAMMICGSLELFSICYLFRDEKDKTKLIYILFGIGLILLAFAIIYTIIKTT